MHNSKPDAQWKKTLLPKPNKQQESKEDNQFQRERKKMVFHKRKGKKKRSLEREMSWRWDVQEWKMENGLMSTGWFVMGIEKFQNKWGVVWGKAHTLQSWTWRKPWDVEIIYIIYSYHYVPCPRPHSHYCLQSPSSISILINLRIPNVFIHNH